MRASGLSGELRVGYQLAATLGAWTLGLEAQLPRTYAFKAVVLSEHAYWRTQRPLDLVLALGTTEWIWRDVAPVPEDGGGIVLELRDCPIVSERIVAQQRGR